MITILFPGLLLSILVAFLSAQTSFHIAPWGNRQFEILISKLEQTKAGTTLREGTFSEGFFDLVFYANEVDSKKGALKKIFIYDERDKDSPLTIISKTGKILQDSNLEGRSVFLRLENGDIHRQGETHTKIKYNTFDIRLFDPAKEQLREKSPPSLSLEEIFVLMNNKKLPADELRILDIELHKRWAIAILCVIFGVLGVGLGTSANTRHQKGSGFITSFIVVVAYWVIYVTCEGIARSGQLPVPLLIWLPNSIFAIYAAYNLKKIWD
jgi:lipopolysaccharide export system permease protein